MLQGALFGAIAGLTARASLCHAMAYPVGNRYHTYHGETIAALTPASTLGYNAGSDPERFARLARRLPSGLAELAGVDEDDVDWLARQTVETQQRLLRCNPRPVTEADVHDVFVDALYNWEP